RVQAMAWSPNGEALLIGTTTGQIAEILPTSGGMTTLVASGPSVESIVMLPDGFATGHSDRVVRIWSEDGALARSLPDQGGLVQALAVDPTGHWLAIGGGDGSVRVMPLQGDTLPQVIGRHGSAVRTLRFVSSDRLASGGGDDVVRLWDIGEGEQVAVATGHAGDILALTVSGAFIASAGEDGDIRIWSSQDLSPVDVLRGHGDLAWSITALDDRQVLSLGRDGMLRWWITSPPPPESVRMNGRLPATAMTFIDPWHLVATSELDTGVREFDLATGEIRDHRTEGIHELTALVAANRGRIATGDTAGTIKVWRLDSESPPTTIGSHTAQVSAMAIAPDFTTLVSGSYDGTVTLWDLATDLRGIELPKQDAIVLDVAVDGKKIYTATSGDRVSAWTRSDGSEVWRYDGHDGDVQVITLIPEQGVLVTSALNGALYLLDVETGAVVAMLTNPGGAVREIVAMPGGRRFMTISGDGTMTFWDTLLPGVVASLHAPQALECAVLSPDGTLLAVGGEQPIIHLLDTMRRGERLSANGNSEQ
ncbi:MAG: WD40 repeat domain-containing protein, partial [Phycisphaerales bacterium]|nr:WD40 repeat domain-containing protein [Phycisphaerales bacterium]